MTAPHCTNASAWPLLSNGLGPQAPRSPMPLPWVLPGGRHLWVILAPVFF